MVISLMQMINKYRKNNFFLYFLFSILISFLIIIFSQILLFKNIQKKQIEAVVRDIQFKSTLVSLGLENLPLESIQDISGIILKRDLYHLNLKNLFKESNNFSNIIQKKLCENKKNYCPKVQTDIKRDNYWVEVQSPFEKIWMLIETNNIKSYNNPFQILLSLIIGSTSGLILFFNFEVNRPLRKIEKYLRKIKVGEFKNWEEISFEGTDSVRSLIHRINKMGKRLEIGEKERAETLAGIAHDLKSPLARLQMRLGQNINKNKPSLEDLKSLNIILEKFLIFANSSNQESFVKVPMNDFILELLSSYNEKFELDLFSTFANIQPTAMRRALINLIDNAIQYGESPYKIQMFFNKQRNILKITIWDSGKGVLKKYYEEIVEPFKRLDKSRKGTQNCGLGLSIVSKIAKSHNGKLEFEKDKNNNLFGASIIIKS